MAPLTDKELNWMALRYAGTRVVALALVIGLNVFAGLNGYDLRNWEWWAVVPALCIFLPYLAVRLGESR